MTLERDPWYAQWFGEEYLALYPERDDREARQQAAFARELFLRADIRQLPFRAGTFGAAVNFFTSFGSFEDPAEDLRVVREVARVLAPGGAFLSDVFNAERVRIRRRYDPSSRRVQKEIEMGSGENRRLYTECVRAYTEHELRNLHRTASLTVRAAYGNFDGSPFDRRKSPRLILLAVKGMAKTRTERER